MKRNFLYFLGCMLMIAQACSDDDSSAPNPPPGDPDALTSLELVNAFPQLDFQQPLDLQSPSDGTDRLFVVQQGGVIRVFENEETATETGVFLDISSQIDTSSGELGLLGLAFDPDYQTNGYFYVYYTPSADESVLSRFQVSDGNPAQADPGSERVLLRIEQPATNHNGGQLVFGPDGMLYIALGDGGSGGKPSQELGNLLGKILRIDVRNPEGNDPYSIPEDNPFLDTEGARPEIYAYGLRNPWRMSFDTETGTLWAADVGQNEYEEINVIEAGANYGWNRFEGDECYGGSECDTDGLVFPVHTYNHAQGDKSVTGGFVYRGSALPDLVGHYVYADFISGRVWALEAIGSNPENTLLEESGLNIASFGTDAQQELYICSFDGNIYRLAQEGE